MMRLWLEEEEEDMCDIHDLFFSAVLRSTAGMLFFTFFLLFSLLVLPFPIYILTNFISASHHAASFTFFLFFFPCSTTTATTTTTVLRVVALFSFPRTTVAQILSKC